MDWDAAGAPAEVAGVGIKAAIANTGPATAHPMIEPEPSICISCDRQGLYSQACKDPGTDAPERKKPDSQAARWIRRMVGANPRSACRC